MAVLEPIVDALDVALRSVIVCSVGHGYRIALTPQAQVLVHFVLDGNGVFEVDGAAPIAAVPKQVLIIPRLRAKRVGPARDGIEVPHTTGCSLTPDRVLQVAIGGDQPPTLRFACGVIETFAPGGIDPFSRMTEPMVVDLGGSPAGEALYALLRAETMGSELGSRAILEALIKQCLILALRTNAQRSVDMARPGSGTDDVRLLRALAAVQSAPAAAHSIATLAESAGMSRSVFFARFAESFGQPPMEYVLHVRLDCAARLLAAGNTPVKRIASDVGFASRSHFSRAFRARFGIDPSGYRRQLVGSAAA
ncbi:MAG: AraC family transcriptional regulator [Pseudomonadota bacterium]